ncbi:class I SAM-dependent methyltransferase [Roseibium sp.]|uniref:class I SAM-dependent methyltransferase n=1 Tax=Roseibium sp. TaxID=1936156 RepID=UPI003BB1234B
MASSSGTFSFDRRELSRFLYDLYDYEPKMLRRLISARPYVCPFDEIERHVPQGARLLDVGSGNGALLAILLAAGRIREAVGCDVHEGALVSARTATGRTGQGGQVAFRKIDGFEDLPGEQFDVVTMIDVLHHIAEKDRARAVDQSLERVAPGGIFLFKDMVEGPYWRRLAHNLDDYIFSGEWVTQVKTAELRKQVLNSGFDLVEDMEIPRLWYGNTLLVFRRVSK